MKFMRVCVRHRCQEVMEEGGERRKRRSRMEDGWRREEGGRRGPHEKAGTV
jgi:hypothetical protein